MRRRWPGSDRRTGCSGHAVRVGCLVRTVRVSGAAIVGALALAGCAQSSGAGGAGDLTLYSGQHVQTTQALVAAFERETRHRGASAFGRRGRTGRPDRDRGVPVAGRRVLHRELAAAAVPRLEGPAGSGGPGDARPHPVPLQLAQRPVGGRVGPGERDDLQHVAAQARPAPEVGHGAGGPQVERPDRDRGQRDGLPAHRDEHRADPRRGGGTALARGGQGERGEPRLPRQRDGDL